MAKLVADDDFALFIDKHTEISFDGYASYLDRMAIMKVEYSKSRFNRLRAGLATRSNYDDFVFWLSKNRPELIEWER